MHCLPCMLIKHSACLPFGASVTLSRLDSSVECHNGVEGTMQDLQRDLQVLITSRNFLPKYHWQH